MSLSETPSWDTVEICVEYLVGKGIHADDAKCSDQVCNLKSFVEGCISDDELTALPSHKKWCRYFQQSKNLECHSELLKIAQFFFAVAPHNANVERIFSLMQSQWTKERNKMTVDTIKGILTLQYNFKNMSCGEFHVFLNSNKTLLKKIRSSEKYD